MAWLSSNDANAAFSAREVVDDTEAWQVEAREWGTTFWKRRIRTRVSELRGLTRDAALALSANSSSASSKITNSYGSAYFEHYSCQCRKSKSNAADGWKVTFTERWQAAYQNGTLFSGCAAHYFTDSNPAVPGDSSGPNTIVA